MDISNILKNFKPLKFVFQLYTLEDLKKDKLVIDRIKEEEVQYLKDVGDNTVISLMNSDNSIDVVKYLRSLNKNNKIIITISDKKQFNKDLFSSDINPDNIYIKTDYISNEISLKEYIYNENILYSMIEGAKDLSPLEKYLYAYDVVKKLKQYKEHKKDKLKSRNLYSILFNNYIVCSGFTTLLTDLLEKLDIQCVNESVEVGLSANKAIEQLKKKYDWKSLSPIEKNKLINEQMTFIPQSFEKHSRMFVNIKDPKYGIDGIFASDSTWDNDLNNNLYTHTLMSQKRATSTVNKLKLTNNATELFYSSDTTEFFNKYHFLLSRSTDEYNNIENCTKGIINDLLKKFKKLDIDFYNELMNKYSFSHFKTYSYDYLQNILSDISLYVVNKFNVEVPFSTIISAIKVVYNDAYVDGLNDDDINQIIKDNTDDRNLYFGSNKH